MNWKRKSSPVPYADTTVSVLKSRHDIDALLDAWGVEGTQWTVFGRKSALRFQFRHQDRVYTARILIDPEEQGRSWDWRSKRSKDAHLDHEAMRLHRTLYWYVKSKIEAIQAGLETPAQAWLAAIEGPRGHTIYQELEVGLREIQAGNLATIPALHPASVNKVEVMP